MGLVQFIRLCRPSHLLACHRLRGAGRGADSGSTRLSARRARCPRPPRRHRSNSRSTSSSKAPRPVPGCRSTRATSRPRPRRDHRHGRRLARADQPRRVRHLRHGLRRHQLADQVPRRQSRGRRSRRCSWSTTSRRSPIVGRKSRGVTKPKDLEGKKLGAPARTAPTRNGRSSPGQRHRRLQGDDRERRLPGARADAGSRPGRRHHRLLVLVSTST